MGMDGVQANNTEHTQFTRTALRRENYEERTSRSTRDINDVVEVSHVLDDDQMAEAIYAVVLKSQPGVAQLAKKDVMEIIREQIKDRDSDGYKEFDVDDFAQALEERYEPSMLRTIITGRVSLCLDKTLLFNALRMSELNGSIRFNTYINDTPGAIRDASPEIEVFDMLGFFEDGFDPLNLDQVADKFEQWAIGEGLCKKTDGQLVFTNRQAAVTFTGIWNSYFRIFVHPGFLDGSGSSQALLDDAFEATTEGMHGLAKFQERFNIDGRTVALEKVQVDCGGYAEITARLAGRLGFTVTNQYAIMAEDKKPVGHAISSFTVRTREGDSFLIGNNGNFKAAFRALKPGETLQKFAIQMMSSELRMPVAYLSDDINDFNSAFVNFATTHKENYNASVILNSPDSRTTGIIHDLSLGSRDFDKFFKGKLDYLNSRMPMMSLYAAQTERTDAQLLARSGRRDGGGNPIPRSRSEAFMAGLYRLYNRGGADRTRAIGEYKLVLAEAALEGIGKQLKELRSIDPSKAQYPLTLTITTITDRNVGKMVETPLWQSVDYHTFQNEAEFRTFMEGRIQTLVDQETQMTTLKDQLEADFPELVAPPPSE